MANQDYESQMKRNKVQFDTSVNAHRGVISWSDFAAVISLESLSVNANRGVISLQ
jgi:hypothetical protein